MSKRNTQKFIQHTEDITPELREEALHVLISEHSCSFDLQPDWCVWGRDQHGGVGLLYWIRTQKNSETIAKCIAELISHLVEMPELKKLSGMRHF